jgi:predicted transcriptional regulator
MSNINAKLETLQAAQAALRESLYDFQDALLDRADGTEHHHDVKDLLEEAEKHMDRLERSTCWAATYIN